MDPNMLLLRVAFATLALASTALAEEVKVGQALRSQTSLIRTREHCGVTEATLKAKGWKPGQQIRLTHDGITALYTIEVIGPETRADAPDIRIGKTGRDRIGAPDAFEAKAEPFGPHPKLTDREAQARGEFIERIHDDGTQAHLLLLAPHGGDIERHTDEQALRVRETLGAGRASVWVARGFKFPPSKKGPSTFLRWHITSADFSEVAFPGLGKVGNRKYAHAVSFHGMENPGLLLGGSAPKELRGELKAELEKVLPPSVTVKVAGANDGLNGDGPRNIVNRYCPTGGIQIEQGSVARREHGMLIADTVAAFFAKRPPR